MKIGDQSDFRAIIGPIQPRSEEKKADQDGLI